MNKNSSTYAKDKVCRNHPDRQATSRCETCLTPICDECTYLRHNLAFCSRNCAANHDVVNRNLERFEKKKQMDRRLRRLRRVGMFTRICVYCAVFGFALWYYLNYTDRVHNWMNRILNFLR